MNILTAEFLSIEEVAIYLEKTGDSYDLEKQHEYKRLHSKIYNLITQHNISAVFHYYGMLQEEIEEVEYDEDIYTGEPVRIPIFQEVNSVHANGHYYVNKAFLKNILINDVQVELDSYISKYGKTASTFQNQELSYSLHNSIYISSRDIRIPKCELDTFFEEAVLNSNRHDQVNEPNQKLLDNERLSHAGAVGNHKILQGNPKTDKQIIDELRKLIVKLTTENDKLQSQPKQQMTADDEPTHHKSVGSMQALVTTLIKMAEYDKADLADPYGELNKLIQSKAEVLGLSVKKDFIAKWLKKANEVL